ncbi:MAG: YkvA family protein [Bacillota bacterium]|jgi:uncharacterized membrane protein YkvA (DUF1232 family)
MDHNIDEQKALAVLKRNYGEAEDLLNDYDKMERFLQRLEKKLKTIPKAGNILAVVPTMVSLIRSYIKKEYTDIPIGTVIAIISALIYFLYPIDLIPDAILGAGYTDDAVVIIACLKLVKSDVDEYAEWREKNGKVIDK